MSYITIQDCGLDPALSELVQQTDIDESDVFFVELANNLGVYSTEIKTNPFPVPCKRVLRLWVYCEVCKRNIGQNINRTQDGYETDWYKAKLAQYEKDLSTAMASLTPNTIRGINVDNINDNQKRSNAWGRA